MQQWAAGWEPRSGDRVAVRIVRGGEALDRTGEVLHVLGDGVDRRYTISVLSPPDAPRATIWHVSVPLDRLSPEGLAAGQV